VEFPLLRKYITKSEKPLKDNSSWNLRRKSHVRKYEAKFQIDDDTSESNTYAASPETASAVTFTNESTGSSTIEQTTRFIDAKASVEDTMLSSYSKISELDDVHSIVQFLQRPTLLYDTTLTDRGSLIPIFPGPLGRTRLGQIVLPNDILTKGRKLDKVSNFEYFKATSVIKIMTNANPTVCGRLWICFAPLQDHVGVGYRMMDKSLASLTSYPGIELDLQLNNSVTLDIPWLDEKECCSLSQSDAEIRNANVHVYQLTPIMASGPFKINLQVFGWFKDIELKGPTGRVPQLTPTRYRANLQIAKEAPGPVTEISGMIATGASALKDVPIIGTAASAVSWVAGLTSKVASIFGWSRPVNGSASEPYCNIPARGYGAIKASDNSVVLGFSNDNSVAEIENNFTQDTDEMQVEHVSNRPAIVYSGLWLDNAITNAVLFEMPVGPQINVNVRTTQIGDDLLCDLSLFEYLATLFGYWRADLHFRISFVKTAFHTGRVEIFYVPGLAGLDDISTIDSTNCYRQILDLSEQSEFEMVVPYMSPYIMSSCFPFNEGEDMQHAPGRFIVRALTPLTHPDNVSTEVGIIVWKWATNVAFSAPIDQGMSTYHYAPSKKIAASLQINVSNVAQIENMVVFGQENTEKNNLDAVQTVCGDIIVSLRALTRAHRTIAYEVTNNFVIGTNVGDAMGGYIAKVANIYSFYRGGLSFKLRPSSDDQSRTGWTRTELCRQLTSKPILSTQTVSHYTYNALNPFHEVMVPYYSNLRRSLVNSNKFGNAFEATQNQPGIRVQGSADSFQTLIAGKDDFTCGMLIGCPIQYRYIGD